MDSILSLSETRDSLAAFLTGVNCPHCSIKNEIRFIRLSDGKAPEIKWEDLLIAGCLGCGTRLDLVGLISGISTPASSQLHKAYCLLECLERFSQAPKPSTPPKASTPSPPKKWPSTPFPVSPSDWAYDDQWSDEDLPPSPFHGGQQKKVLPKGVGYGDSTRGDRRKDREIEQKTRARQSQDDITIGTILSELSKTLRQIPDGEPVHPALPTLLCASPLLPLLATLLRNDSLLDLAQRSDLYFPVLWTLDSLSVHGSFLHLISGVNLSDLDKPERKIHLSPSVPPSITTAAPASSTATATHKTTIVSLLENIERQAQIFMKSFQSTAGQKLAAEAGSGEFDENFAASISLASDVISLFQKIKESLFIAESLSGVPSSLSEKAPALAGGGSSSSDVSVSFEAKLKPIQFATIPISNYYTSSVGSHASDAHYHHRRSTTAVNPRKRLLKIQQEISMLSTSLPLANDASIFIRVNEDSYDIMQALVSGPKGSPYENGLFLFDIMLPEGYPGAPPKMKSMTTGQGSVRFNPNLYADGKICLSLLGTWSGEPWDPEKSTIWQVLISIQSMILGTSDPYYNEPGFESRTDEQASAQYNAGCRSQTVRWAMIDMMVNPPEAFRDVIAEYFTVKRPEITQQVQLWSVQATAAKPDPRGHGGPPIIPIDMELLNQAYSVLEGKSSPEDFKKLMSSRAAAALPPPPAPHTPSFGPSFFAPPEPFVTPPSLPAPFPSFSSAVTPSPLPVMDETDEEEMDEEEEWEPIPPELLVQTAPAAPAAPTWGDQEVDFLLAATGISDRTVASTVLEATNGNMDQAMSMLLEMA